MPNRTDDIRARVDAWRELRYPCPPPSVLVDDLAYLLSTLEAANERIAILRAEVTDLEDARA